MARLGELLVAAGLIDTDKLEQALRAQVVWGGRLGTNLIELGFIGLDDLSRALGLQHGVPAALARHFERADPALQQTLPPELAHRYSFVPLLRLADDKVAIAGIDPLDTDARAVVAAALFVEPANVVMSVAAEQRMRYQLERVYAITRSARFLRSRGNSIPPFPQFGDFEQEADSDVEVEIPITWDDAVDEDAPTVLYAPQAEAPVLEALIDDAMAITPASEEPAGRERRTYVKTLDETPPPAALGRIAIRKVAIGPIAPRTPQTTDTLAAAARAIRRGAQRDLVAELVLDALSRFAPTCEAAMLFVIRGVTAIAWKHFCRSGATAAELAVPLDQVGLVPRAIEHAATQRAGAAELGAIDQLLLGALDKPGGDLAIVPIAIAGRVISVIAIATEPAAVLSNVDTIATAAGTAFARLMRDASR